MVAVVADVIIVLIHNGDYSGYRGEGVNSNESPNDVSGARPSHILEFQPC